MPAAAPAAAARTAATGPAIPAAPPPPATVGVPGIVAVHAPAVVAATDTVVRPGPPTLPEQLVPRIAALRTAADGTHRLTLRVEPESMGPVRVVAEIRGDVVRLELHGATDLARESLRSALPDLRRDLAASGLAASLDLGADTKQTATPGGERQRRPGPDGGRGPAPPPEPEADIAPDGRVDVLA